jgi:uncharacterized protein (DUF4415 family)
MKRSSTKINSHPNAGRTSKGRITITPEIRKAWEDRDKSLDNAEVPQLPPEMWAKATIGKYYRPIKKPVYVRIDSDVLAWLKSKGEGHLTRINTILRERMLTDG